MSATYKGLGTVDTTWTGAASLTLSLPTYAAGDLVLIVCGFRSSSNVAPSAPSGWAADVAFSGGGGTFGVDAGPCVVATYLRVMDGTEGSTVSVPAVASGSGATFTAVTQAIAFSCSAGEEWSWVSSYGADTASGTSWSVSAADTIDIRSGDLLVASSEILSDTPTWSAYSATASGATLGSMTNRVNTSTATGNDSRLYVSTAACTAGTATAAPVLTGTLSSAVTGVSVITRLRAVTPVTADMSAFTTALQNRLSAPVRILTVGDSVTEGQGVDAKSKTWVTKFAANMRSKNSDTTVQEHFQAASSMYSPSTWGTAAFTQTSGSYDNGVSATYASWPYMSWTTGTAGATLIFTGTGQYVDLWYFGGLGTFTWKVDAGSATSVNNTGQSGSAQRVRIDTGSNASHTVTVTHVSGTTTVTGVTTYGILADRDDGIQVFRAGHSGTEVRHFNAQQSAWLTGVGQLAPHLVIIELGLNELLNNPATSTPAAYETELTSMVAGLQTLSPAPSIAIVSMYGALEAWAPYSSWVQYVDKAKAVATAKGAAWVDLTAWMPQADSFGDYRYVYDAVHPNDTGTTYVAQLVADRFPAVAPGVNVSGTVAAVSGTSLAVTSLEPVAGSSAAVSGSSLAVTLRAVAAGVCAAVSAASLAVTSLAPVSGTAVATSATSGAVTMRAVAAGTSSAVSGSSLAVTSLAPVSGTSVATSGSSLNALALAPVSGMSVAVSGTSLGVTMRAAASGTSVAVSGSALDVVSLAPVAGACAAVSGTSGTVTILSSGASGTVAAVSSTALDVVSLAPVVGVCAAASGTSLGVTLRAPVSGVCAAVSSTSGAVTMRAAAAGTSSAVSGSSLAVTSLAPVSGTVAAASGSSLAVTMRARAEGTVVALSGSYGSVTSRLPVAGTVAAVSAAYGSVLVVVPATAPAARTVAVGVPARGVRVVSSSRLIVVTPNRKVI